MGDSRFRVEYDPISPETAEVAKKELRESPEVIKEGIEKLRELILGEPKLNFKTDDDFLIIFLRPCKYYPASAFDLMKRIADFRAKYSAVVGDLSADIEKAAMLNHNVVNVLVDRDQKGRRILVANIGGAWDTKAISGDQIFRLFYLVHLAAILEPETQVRGAVVILDFDNLSMKQIAQLTPNFSLRLLSFIQDAMPLRLKEVHIVKQPYIFNIVWNVFKPFIREKLKSRLFFHGSKMESLHKHLDPEFLPKNYGGTKPEINYSSANWYPVLKGIDDNICGKFYMVIKTLQF
ncbi:hypothetical protein AAG570_001360 [Ranatra chinensis]|uniref:CRAL-TRIO domain-containing protein n=1 Tax=Ranatra chinensis TaxID=642074 RepID=A0ABD0YNC0_9HEMI